MVKQYKSFISKLEMQPQKKKKQQKLYPQVQPNISQLSMVTQQSSQLEQTQQLQRTQQIIKQKQTNPVPQPIKKPSSHSPNPSPPHSPESNTSALNTSTLDRQQKQLYLRQKILDPGYEPEQFILYLNAKLDIDSDIDRCSFEDLEEVVKSFIAKKKRDKEEIVSYYREGNNREAVSISMITQPSICERSSSVKQPAKVLIRSNPQIVDEQYFNSLKCVKVTDKYEHMKQPIICQVKNPERKYVGGILGIGGTSFLCFDVWSYGLSKQPVSRRYSDFIWLRNMLIKFYPSEIIPPIPNKKASKRLPRQVQKRMRVLTFFLNDVVKMPVLLNNKYVQGFLLIKDQNKFQQLKQQGQKMKSYQSALSSETLSGKVQLQLSNTTTKYKDGLLKFVPQVQILYKQITRNSKKMKALTTQKINLLFSMANQFASLFQISNKFNYFIKSEPTEKLSQIYAVLNNTMVEWGNSLKKEIDEIEKNMCTFFKYVREEFIGYKEVLERTRLAEESWLKQKDILDKQKQKIFQLRDPKKWNIPKKTLQNFPKSAIYDRSQAYKIMLPKQSVQVLNLKQNYSFFLSQLYIHGKQNFLRCIDRFCENFKQFCIKMKVNNQQVGAMWTQVSSKFSDPFKRSHNVQFMQMEKIGDDQPSNNSAVYDD